MSKYKALKEECYEANLLLPHHRLIDLTFSNVSVSDPARGVFAIKPSGVGYSKLKAKHMVVVDFDGKIVKGKRRPSADTPTHQRLFQAFAGIRAVVHTHSRHAVAFAQAQCGIPCLGTTHADYFYGEVPVTRPLTPDEIQRAYEWEIGNVIVERFRGIDPLKVSAVLVARDGSFAWGQDGRRAVENALALEIVAEMALKTFGLNPAIEPLPQALLDKHFLRKHGSGAYYGRAMGSKRSSSRQLE